MSEPPCCTSVFKGLPVFHVSTHALRLSFTVCTSTSLWQTAFFVCFLVLDELEDKVRHYFMLYTREKKAREKTERYSYWLQKGTDFFQPVLFFVFTITTLQNHTSRDIYRHLYTRLHVYLYSRGRGLLVSLDVNRERIRSDIYIYRGSYVYMPTKAILTLCTTGIRMALVRPARFDVPHKLLLQCSAAGDPHLSALSVRRSSRTCACVGWEACCTSHVYGIEQGKSSLCT